MGKLMSATCRRERRCLRFRVQKKWDHLALRGLIARCIWTGDSFAACWPILKNSATEDGFWYNFRHENHCVALPVCNSSGYGGFRTGNA
jgi:hypothetical protein